jgi:hypothetical protein
LQNAPFDPETIKTMSIAFERVCRTLGSVDDDGTSEVIAKKIINFAQQGMADVDQLTQATLKSLRKQPPAASPRGEQK